MPGAEASAAAAMGPRQGRTLSRLPSSSRGDGDDSMRGSREGRPAGRPYASGRIQAYRQGRARTWALNRSTPPAQQAASMASSASAPGKKRSVAQAQQVLATWACVFQRSVSAQRRHSMWLWQAASVGGD